MKISKLVFCALGMLVALFAAGCNSSEKQIAPNQPKPSAPIQQFIIGVDSNFRPMTFWDNSGKLVGLDIDLATEACKRAGLKPKFKAIDWKRKVEELESKSIDAVWSGLTVSQWREKVFNLTDPYIINPQMIVSLKGTNIISNGNLTGLTIGVEKGSHGEYVLQNGMTPISLRHNKLKAYTNTRIAHKELENKQIHCIVEDAVVAYDNNMMNNGKYSLLKLSDGDTNFAIGFRKDDRILISKIEDALQEMKKDGTARKICEKWLGVDLIVYSK